MTLITDAEFVDDTMLQKLITCQDHHLL